MEYSENLDQRFKKLGFDNFKDFYKDASPIPEYPDKQNALLEAHLMDDLYSDPDEIGYLFVVAKEPQTEQWYIHSIDAAIQFNTKRNQEGVLVINSNHTASQKPLPHKNEIRKDLLEKLSIEKAKELASAIKSYAGQINGTKRRV